MLAGLPYYVIAGDFNTRGKPHREVAREVLSWSGFEQVPGIEKTHKYVPGSWGRLDHIFVSENLEVESSGVDSKWSGTGSDHRPLWAVLRISGPSRKAWDGFAESEPWDARTDPSVKQCEVNR
jgi:endonuclease/exonuclease/phosphatase family metal-dependent hydrolase